MNSSLDREIKEFQQQLIRGLFTESEAFGVLSELQEEFKSDDIEVEWKFLRISLLIKSHFQQMNIPKRQIHVFQPEIWHKALGDDQFNNMLHHFEIVTTVKGAAYIEEFEKSKEEPEPLITPEKVHRMIKGMIERYDRKRSI